MVQGSHIGSRFCGQNSQAQTRHAPNTRHDAWGSPTETDTKQCFGSTLGIAAVAIQPSHVATPRTSGNRFSPSKQRAFRPIRRNFSNCHFTKISYSQKFQITHCLKTRHSHFTISEKMPVLICGFPTPTLTEISISSRPILHEQLQCQMLRAPCPDREWATLSRSTTTSYNHIPKIVLARATLRNRLP